MRPALTATARHHHGLVTRTQALDHGYTERELRTLTRPGGEWHVVRRGVYMLDGAWQAASPAQRYRLEVRAALLNARSSMVVSHASAAALLGLDLLAGPDLVHLTRTGVLGGRTEHGVKYHPARVEPVDVIAIDELDVTSPARTAADVGREQGYLHGLVVADQVLRHGTHPADLARVAASMRCWPGITRARAALTDADGRAESLGETLLRVVVTGLGLGRPQPQFRIADGTRTAYADLRLSHHIFEFDGRVKYRLDRPYDDDRPPEDVLWEEKQREDWVRGHGFGMSRVTWGELWAPRLEQTERRLVREVMATRARVGDAAWREGLEETAHYSTFVVAPRAS